MLMIVSNDHSALGGVHVHMLKKNIKTRMWTKSNYISSWVVQLEAGRFIMGEQIDVKNANTTFYVCTKQFISEEKRETRKPCCCFSFTLIINVLSSLFIFSTSVVTVPWLRWCCWLRSKHYNIGASVETLCCLSSARLSCPVFQRLIFKLHNLMNHLFPLMVALQWGFTLERHDNNLLLNDLSELVSIIKTPEEEPITLINIEL